MDKSDLARLKTLNTHPISVFLVKILLILVIYLLKLRKFY